MPINIFQFNPYIFSGPAYSYHMPISAVPEPTDIYLPSEPQISHDLGHRLACSTLEAAASNDDLDRLRCYRFVKRGLRAEGIFLSGGSAYQAARQLARNPNFQEVKRSRAQLADLPEGAIVVWNRNALHPDGHISVALGDGREVSDRIRPQIKSYRSSFRVFLPQNKALPKAA